MEVEFFGPQPVPPVSDALPLMPKPAAFPDDGGGVCGCTHPFSEHGVAGLCLRGCGVEECGKPELTPT